MYNHQFIKYCLPLIILDLLHFFSFNLKNIPAWCVVSSPIYKWENGERLNNLSKIAQLFSETELIHSTDFFLPPKLESWIPKIRVKIFPRETYKWYG